MYDRANNYEAVQSVSFGSPVISHFSYRSPATNWVCLTAVSNNRTMMMMLLPIILSSRNQTAFLVDRAELYKFKDSI
jgi:hypothetical protein